MFEGLKNRKIIILAVLCAVFLFSTVNSCVSSLRQKEAHDKEMAARLSLEEKMNRFSQDKSVLEERAKAKEKEAQELKSALEAAKKELLQGQLVNQSLKEELDKVIKSKGGSEENSKGIAPGAKKLKK